MSGYIRSIRSIEPTARYAATARLDRYALYPRGSLPVTGERETDWERQYKLAAESAGEWLAFARRSQAELDRILANMSRALRIGADASAWGEEASRLIRLLNDTEETYRKLEAHLKPEVWAAIELALRHPGAEAIGLYRQDGAYFGLNAGEETGGRLGQDGKERWRRLLLGSDGLLHGLKRALDYAEQRKAVDLLKLPFPSGYPYALYYGAMYTYWPMPVRGVVLNRYY